MIAGALEGSVGRRDHIAHVNFCLTVRGCGGFWFFSAESVSAGSGERRAAGKAGEGWDEEAVEEEEEREETRIEPVVV